MSKLHYFEEISENNYLIKKQLFFFIVFGLLCIGAGIGLLFIGNGMNNKYFTLFFCLLGSIIFLRIREKKIIDTTKGILTFHNLFGKTKQFELKDFKNFYVQQTLTAGIAGTSIVSMIFINNKGKEVHVGMRQFFLVTKPIDKLIMEGEYILSLWDKNVL